MCLQEVRQIFEGIASWEGEDTKTSGHLVSSAWLEEWANAETKPEPVNNKPLLCPHGALDPNKVGHMKLVSGTAWQQMEVRG